MELTVLRHGIAVDRMDPACPTDAERWLTPKGVRRTTAACHGLAALEVAPSWVLTSPLVRARQTATIAAEVLGAGQLLETDALAGGTRTDAIFEELQALPAARVLVVGHAPHLDLLIARSLANGPAGVEWLKKAGAAQIEFDDAATPGQGRLVWLMQPRALRARGQEA